MKKIAVTGSIASGKSTVCSFFEDLGAYAVSADKIVHQLLTPETDLGKDLIGLFGDQIIQDGKLDRQAIAEKAFRNIALLQQLEKRIHPEVQKAINAEYNSLSTDAYPLFIVEVPLLYESGMEIQYDAVIVVVADEEISMQRYMSAGLGGAEQFARRFQRLFSMQEKSKRANFTIENNGSFEDLRVSVQSIFNTLKGNV